MVKTREEYMINHLPNDLCGAELGVFEGEFSKILKSTNKFSKLYLVDIFEGPMYSGDKNGENGKNIDLDISYQRLLYTYKNDASVNIIKDTTSNFLTSLDDNSLSFVYIDADHSYEGVTQDLNLSRIKVCPDGIISGHDYNQNSFEGVFRAVNEFIQKFNLHAIFTEEDKLASFFIINKK